MSKDTHAINDEYALLKGPTKLSIDEQNHIKKTKHDNKETSPIIKQNTMKNEETLRKLWIVSGICLVFMTIEIIGGYLANSIAIMSDAAHLLSDFLGFIISIVSIYISRQGATHHMSFGYHRAEVIGALVSVNLIWGLTIWLLYAATVRIFHHNEVDGLIMLITAVIGFIFNIVMGVILAYEGIDHNLHHHHDGEGHDHEGHTHGPTISRTKTMVDMRRSTDNSEPLLKHAASISHKPHDHEHENKHDHKHDHDHDHKDHDHKDHDGHAHSDKNSDNIIPVSHDNHDHDHDHGNKHENINLRAALIHVLGDAVQNLGVVIAGFIIYFFPHLSVADPICTYVFSIIVAFTTIRILRDCLAVLMEGSPLEFDMANLEKDLIKIKGVVEIHDLHVWSLSIGKLSLSCHLTSTHPQISLKKAMKLIKEKYKITHSTIQVELDSDKASNDCLHDLHGKFE